MSELNDGNLVVFCQVPQEALEHTPAVARVLVGCHLDAVFAAKGEVDGRVFFPIDEAILIGRDPALKIARDQGKKSKITLQLFYQSEGQMKKCGPWPVNGPGSTACPGAPMRVSRTSKVPGTVGYSRHVRCPRHVQGDQPRQVRQGDGNANAWRGSNISDRDRRRSGRAPHELLGMRDGERITLVRNRPPMRHGAAIGFRRPEIAPPAWRNQLPATANPCCGRIGSIMFGFDNGNSIEPAAPARPAAARKPDPAEIPVREATPTEMRALRSRPAPHDSETDAVARRHNLYMAARRSTRIYYTDYQQKSEVMRQRLRGSQPGWTIGRPYRQCWTWRRRGAGNR